MKNLILPIFFCATFLGPNAIAQSNRSTLSDTIYANISVAQSVDTIAAHADDPWFVILDVRTPSEYATKHIEEGVNLDFYLTDFSAQLATLNKSKTYLIHCAAGSRSGQVYTLMQTMNFKRVYNMTGGINAWSAAVYPTTTTTLPELGVLCDTNAIFNAVHVAETDSLLLTITNTANDILTFGSISDLSETRFSTNFDINTVLSGAQDYSFYVYFNPDDALADSAILTVQSSGGSLDFALHGTGATTTNINRSVLQNISIFNDIEKRQIVIYSNNSPYKIGYSLYDVSGKLIITSDLSGSNVIDYSEHKNGVYLLRINSAEGLVYYKIPLFAN